jgi:hypothetical protein
MQIRPTIRVKLTPEQLSAVRQVTHLEAAQQESNSAQEWTPEVLEERIAPAINLNSSKSNVP